jgi:hypothetical protein
MLIDRYEQAREAEDVLRMIRDLDFSDEIYPAPSIDSLRFETAHKLAMNLDPSHVEAEAVARLRRRLIELCGGGLK